jgi:hypothetical protein
MYNVSTFHAVLDLALVYERLRLLELETVRWQLLTLSISKEEYSVQLK